MFLGIYPITDPTLGDPEVLFSGKACCLNRLLGATGIAKDAVSFSFKDTVTFWDESISEGLQPLL